MANPNDYNIPLGIDPSGFLTGLEKMEAGLDGLTNTAKTASTSITQTLGTIEKSGDALVTKMNAGAASAKMLQDAAVKAGTSVENMLSPERVKTGPIEAKVTQFISKLKDAFGKPIDFKFNLESAKVAALVTELGKAKNEMQAFDIVLKSAKDRLATLDKGSAGFKELETQISSADNFLKAFASDTEEVVAKTTSLKGLLREMKADLAEMELAGKGGSKEFIELSKRAGELSDQLQDTNQRIKNLASDTKGLDAGITAIRGLAGAFAVGQGALAAFGANSEEAAKAIQKVQGALAILQGVQEVANVLNKDSALIVYLKTFALKADTAATVAETVAIEAETVATEEATAATNRFTAALLRNPIVLIIAALAAVTFAVYKFATAEKEAGLSVDELNKKLKQQQDFLEEDQAIITRRVNLAQAQADLERRTQSELTKIKISELQARLAADNRDILDREDLIKQTRQTDEKSIAAVREAQDEIEKLKLKTLNTQNQIDVERLHLQKQRIDEENKLALDLLHEKQQQAEAQRTILKEAQDYANQITNIRIAELRDGQQKEIAILRQAAIERIQALDENGKLNLIKLENQRKELDLDLDTNRKLLQQKKDDLDDQIALEKENGEKRIQLKKAIVEGEGVEEKKIREKFANELADFEYDIAVKNLELRKQTDEQKIALLELAAKHEIDLIERMNIDRLHKDIAQKEITDRLQKETAQAQLDYTIQQINLEQTFSENKILEQKKYFDRSRDGQALGHLLLLQNELEHQERILKLLVLSGKEQTDAAVVEAKNRVLKLKQAVGEATKDAKAVDIWELLFPNDDAAQKRGKQFISTLQEVGKAVDAYTALLVSRVQTQIDAQKKRVSEDEDALKKLEERLKEEERLRDQGFANNVEGIKKEIEEKNKQREEDVRKQDEYQKRMEKIQKNAIKAQSALQAANIITAATNIYLKSSELGPIGVALGIAAVAAMIFGFISSKTQATEAVNTSSFGGGGEVDGKSHAEGGRKYYSKDGSGKVVELEGGEYVVNKKQTEKHRHLIEEINEGKVTTKTLANYVSMNEMLAAAGVHLMTDETHDDGIKESRLHTANQITQVNVSAPKMPELESIDNNIQKMVQMDEARETIYNEGNYTIIKKGKRTTKIRKN